MSSTTTLIYGNREQQNKTNRHYALVMKDLLKVMSEISAQQPAILKQNVASAQKEFSRPTKP